MRGRVQCKPYHRTASKPAARKLNPPAGHGYGRESHGLADQLQHLASCRRSYMVAVFVAVGAVVAAVCLWPHVSMPSGKAAASIPPWQKSIRPPAGMNGHCGPAGSVCLGPGYTNTHTSIRPSPRLDQSIHAAVHGWVVVRARVFCPTSHFAGRTDCHLGGQRFQLGGWDILPEKHDIRAMANLIASLASSFSLGYNVPPWPSRIPPLRLPPLRLRPPPSACAASGPYILSPRFFLVPFSSSLHARVPRPTKRVRDSRMGVELQLGW